MADQDERRRVGHRPSLASRGPAPERRAEPLGRVLGGILEHALEQVRERGADPRARPDAEDLHHLAARERELGARDGLLLGAREALAQGGEASAHGGGIRLVARGALGLAEREEPRELLLAPGAAPEAAHRGIATGGDGFDRMEGEERLDLAASRAGHAPARQHGRRPRFAQPGGPAEREVGRERGDHRDRVAARPRNQRGIERAPAEQREPGRGRRRREQAFQLGAHALRRELLERLGLGGECGLELRIDRERQLSRDARRAERAERILGEPLLGLSDRDQTPRREIGEAAAGIEQRAGPRVEGQRVQREVAVREIVEERRSAKTGHVHRAARGRHHHGPEAEPDRHRAREEREELLGRGGGRDVPVVHRDAARAIAHAAADQHRFVPGARERVEQRCDRRGQGIEHGPEGTLRPVLRFRAPGSALSAAALVARALALSEARAAGRVRAGALAHERDGAPGERIRDPEARVAPGAALCLDAEPPVAREGEGDWHVLVPTWHVLVPALPWREGRAEGFAYVTVEERGGLALVRLELTGATLAAARAWLAGAGAPVLGDVVHGGILVAGGLRLWPASAEGARSEAPRASGSREPSEDKNRPASEDMHWPEEPVFAPAAPAPEGVLRISAGTARALARGHPWVIADRETERGDRFAPGTLVALRSPDGRSHGLARGEGARDLAARVWSRDSGAASIEARVAWALERRATLLSGQDTDAYRLLHGEADGLPGLAVDRFGPLLRMLVTGRAALPLRERVHAALLAARLPGLASDPPLVEVLHLRERPPGALVSVRLVSGALDAIPEPLIVREGSLCFRVESGLAEPTRPRPGVGFFLDQRDNRARLAARARGGRFLNLFAHTGGFSAALLAGGAERVVSVDLSGPYLADLEANLGRSGLPLERHQGVRREARRFLAELDPGERFDGVVIDPPTAAASGRRFWSVRRDLEPLAAEALRRLAPGGFLLLTRQDRTGRGRLETLLAAAAASAAVELASSADLAPASDFPRLAGFPEGAPFEARLVTRS